MQGLLQVCQEWVQHKEKLEGCRWHLERHLPISPKWFGQKPEKRRGLTRIKVEWGERSFVPWVGRIKLGPFRTVCLNFYGLGAAFRVFRCCVFIQGGRDSRVHHARASNASEQRLPHWHLLWQQESKDA